MYKSKILWRINTLRLRYCKVNFPLLHIAWIVAAIPASGSAKAHISYLWRGLRATRSNTYDFYIDAYLFTCVATSKREGVDRVVIDLRYKRLSKISKVMVCKEENSPNDADRTYQQLMAELFHREQVAVIYLFFGSFSVGLQRIKK